VSKHRRHLAAHFWRLYRLSEEHTLIPGLLTPACFLPAERGIHHEIFRHLLVGIQAHLAIATPRRLLLGECHKCAADAASMAGGINGNVIKQEMVFRWKQHDQPGYRTVALN